MDQHFVRRRRHNRLISLVLEHPDGIGLDESTALEVGPDGKWKVLGESVAVVYDARKARVTPAGSVARRGRRSHAVLPPEGVYDPVSGEAELPAGGEP